MLCGLLNACQPAPPPPTLSSLTLATLPTTGDAAHGQAIFESGVLGSDAAACSACHSLTEVKLSGPSLKGIATIAGNRVAGQDAETYLFNAIVNPDSYLIPGYTKGIMPATYAQKYTPQQLRDVLTYLLTLR